MSSNNTLYNIIGGLEPNDTDKEEILEINNIKYLVNNKFKSLLRNNIIDWGSFLEIYNDTNDYCELFDQAVKILDLDINKHQSENVEENILPILEKMYNSTPEHQLMCMVKQFFTYESLSYSIQNCFNIFKNHFENIVELFIESRNDYIEKHNLRDSKNDWKKLLKHWNRKNDKLSLNSSSVILLFLNPPKELDLKSNINYEIKNNPTISKAINNLYEKIENFYYPGFCPKVPHIRLNNLLTFPLDDFVNVIKLFDNSIVFPDYNKLKSVMDDILKNKIEKPKLDINIKHKEVPENYKNNEENKSKLIKWYITEIIETRKSLLEYGKLYENYYIDLSKKINNIAEKAREILNTDALV